jgi:hypothetical protein
MTGSSIYKMCLLGEVAADMGLARTSQGKHGINPVWTHENAPATSLVVYC